MARTWQHCPNLSARRAWSGCLRTSPSDPPSTTRSTSWAMARRFDAMASSGFEGVVAKSATARYYGGERSPFWLKVKAVKRQEFVVIGWRPPDYGDVDVRGLFLGTYEDGELVYRGG